MALPTAYLTAQKNLEGILTAIRNAQAPEKFTQKFLEDLGFKSNSDRLVINVLKSLGFLDDGGRPTKRYFEYLDQSQSARVMGEGIREAYADLFRVNKNAQTMPKQEVMNKLKTLGEGKLSESVVDKMAMTFLALSKLADFKSTVPKAQHVQPAEHRDVPAPAASDSGPAPALRLEGLVYNFQIVLPESRDPAVYDAIFSSLRTHLK